MKRFILCCFLVAIAHISYGQKIYGQWYAPSQHTEEEKQYWDIQTNNAIRLSEHLPWTDSWRTFLKDDRRFITIPQVWTRKDGTILGLNKEGGVWYAFYIKRSDLSHRRQSDSNFTRIYYFYGKDFMSIRNAIAKKAL